MKRIIIKFSLVFAFAVSSSTNYAQAVPEEVERFITGCPNIIVIVRRDGSCRSQTITRYSSVVRQGNSLVINGSREYQVRCGDSSKNIDSVMKDEFVVPLSASAIEIQQDQQNLRTTEFKGQVGMWCKDGVNCVKGTHDGTRQNTHPAITFGSCNQGVTDRLEAALRALVK